MKKGSSLQEWEIFLKSLKLDFRFQFQITCSAPFLHATVRERWCVSIQPDSVSKETSAKMSSNEEGAHTWSANLRLPCGAALVSCEHTAKATARARTYQPIYSPALSGTLPERTCVTIVCVCVCARGVRSLCSVAVRRYKGTVSPHRYYDTLTHTGRSAKAEGGLMTPTVSTP